MKALATIQLDNDEGYGDLYWADGSIWCRRIEDGEEWDTQNRCKEDDAKETIEAIWRDVFWCLEWK